MVMTLTAGDIEAIKNAVWDEPLTGATHNVPTSAGRRLRQLADVVIIDGTVVSSTNNTVTLDAGASALNGAYDPALIYISSGTGAGQCRLILEYDGATKTAWVDRNWKFNPVLGNEYVIVGDPGREHVNEGHAQSGGVNWIQLNPLASDIDDAYIGQVVFIRSGTGEDQARVIVDYDGTTHKAYVSRAWDVVPDATSSGAILPTGMIEYDNIADAVWGAVLADHLDVGSTGEALNAIGVVAFPAGAISYTYTVTNSVTTLPVEGVDVWVSTDLAGTNIIWRGTTDAFGVARDVNNNLPALDAGTYYFWKQKSGFVTTNPDPEVVV